tara:strand:- start:5072 stop:5224 length:153 start_codon:yes stop_codon:yes gene_type:complete
MLLLLSYVDKVLSFADKDACQTEEFLVADSSQGVRAVLALTVITSARRAG